MIYIQCRVECAECKKVAQAVLSQKVTAGLAGLFGGPPPQSLSIVGEEKPTWCVDLTGETFCSETCNKVYEAKQKAEREAREALAKVEQAKKLCTKCQHSKEQHNKGTEKPGPNDTMIISVGDACTACDCPGYTGTI